MGFLAMQFDCDICNRKIIYPEPLPMYCGECGSAHCCDCLKAAEERGDVSVDADCVGDPPEYVDCSVWKKCLGCKGDEHPFQRDARFDCEMEESRILANRK